MPRINRIRVNNINYNDGTQRFDDFTMSFYGKNGLYDLVNGGGKSILLMMIMQTVLPNQELDKKQPVSKLFKGSNNNTAIHSMVEWVLDKGTKEWAKANYLLAGFCAKKGSEGQGEVEYFNYAITYSAYNDHDIINFPLSEGNEKVGYHGLRKKLKVLKDMDLLNCRVHLFETNESYKRFLAGYGIYESHWNILKGINVSEGRVRTYIEENYRTTRKLVDKLLIEEIIDKANDMKRDVQDNGNELSKSLLDIENKMIELAMKKKDIDSYQYQVKSLETYIQKIDEYSNVLQKESSIWKKYNELYSSVYWNLESKKEECEKNQVVLRDTTEQLSTTKQYLDYLKIEKERNTNENLRKELINLGEKVTKLKEDAKRIESQLCLSESLKYYYALKEDEIKYKKVSSEINQESEDKEEKLNRIYRLTYFMKQMFEENIKSFDDRQQKLEETIASLRIRIQDTKQCIDARIEDNGKNKILFQVEQDKVSHLKLELERIGQQIHKDFLELDEISSLQSDEELLEKYKVYLLELESKLLKEKTEDKELQERLIQMKIEEKVLAESQKLMIKRLEAAASEENIYQEKYQKLKQRKKIYQLEDEVTTEYFLNYLMSKENDEKKVLFQKTLELDNLSKKLISYEEGKIFVENDELLQVYQYLKEIWNEVTLGTDYLKEQDDIRKQDLLRSRPYLPYGIVVSETILREIKRNITFDWIEFTTLVPLFVEEKLLTSKETKEDLYFLHTDSNYYLDPSAVERMKMNLTVLKDKYVKDKKELEHNINNYKSNYDEIRDYYYNYELKQKQWSKEYQVLQKESEDIQNNLEQFRVHIEIIEEQMKASSTTYDDLIKNKSLYEHMISLLMQRIDMVVKLDDSLEKLRTYERVNQSSTIRMEELIVDIESLESKLDVSNEELRFVKEEKNKKLLSWENKYKRYDKDGVYGSCTYTSDELLYELDAAIETYENEYQDVKHKTELLDMLNSSMNRNRYEIQTRNYNMEELEVRVKEGIQVSEGTIQTLRREKESAYRNYEDSKSEYYKKKGSLDTLSGKIHMMLDDYQMKYQNTVEVIEKDRIDLENSYIRYEQQVRELVVIESRLMIISNDLYIECTNLEKLSEKIINYAETMKRRIHSQEVTEQKEPYKVLKESFDNILKEIIIIQKDMDSKLLSCQDAKLKCVKEIASKNVAYAQEIESCPIEKNDKDSMILSANLKQSKEYFMEEINRIDQGLQEIIEIKARFKNRCIQESHQIRADLEKFAKYSKMYIDNEILQAVKLKIHYLPEEVQKNKMEKYIDKIVADASNVSNEEDKKKMLRERLSSKSLFGVIVNEVHGMELYLYKRERIKENSRHLRFEEAVGSTGQSQGIYILLIISIINYIARMYSNEAEDKELTKTIFIDNPFGAAKDVYIWEPILAMLRENNVQLIVPTRGVAPAMTSKFDVYYTLGQEMRGDKLQTVVANFRSDINRKEVEYVKVESSQLELFDMME